MQPKIRQSAEPPPDSTEALCDIRCVTVDESKPVLERIGRYSVEVKNPYLFRVDDTPVRIVFTADGPTLQACLEQVVKKLRA